MQPRISMITLGVADLERSVAFYQALGFPKLEFDGEGVAFFTLNGSWLGLYPKDKLAEDAEIDNDGQGFSGIALAHNLESEALVDATMQEAIKAGAVQVKPPQKVFWGGYSGYFKDPDNYLWELAYNPFAWIGPAAGDAVVS